MTSHSTKILLFVLFLLLIVGLRLSGIGDWLTLENLQRNRDDLQVWVAGHRTAALAAFFLLYVLVVALSLPGGAVMTLGGGYFFGTVTAAVFVVLAATAGAVLAFLSARYLVGGRLQERYAAQLAVFNAEMERNGSRYLLTLRLVPLFPFFLVNFLSGLTRVSLGNFAWTTAAGIVPGTFVFAFAGQQLGTLHSVSDVLSGRVLLALTTLAAFLVLPALWRRTGKKA